MPLPQWYNRTDYPIFIQYQRYRRLHPLQPFYILHPRFEWQVWQRIQDNMAEPIQRNPPSSGFLGTSNQPVSLTYALLCFHSSQLHHSSYKLTISEKFIIMKPEPVCDVTHIFTKR